MSDEGSSAARDRSTELPGFKKDAVQLAIYGSTVGDKGRSVAPALLFLTNEDGVACAPDGATAAMLTRMIARSGNWTTWGLDELEADGWIERRRTQHGLLITWTDEARRRGDEALAARATSKATGPGPSSGGAGGGSREATALKSSGTRLQTPIPAGGDAKSAHVLQFVAKSTNLLERTGLAKARPRLASEKELLCAGGAS